MSLATGQLIVLNEPELTSASLEVWARGPNNRLFSANHSETVRRVYHATLPRETVREVLADH